MSGPDVVVFAGSSLSAKDRSLLTAWYQPPAQQGDVFEAVQIADPRAIAIIDGLFHDCPAVRHREILWALGHGVHVFGSSSMGALRAAELAPQGMVGVGLIYRWYRRTMLAGDDEVAQALGPAELGFRPLSEALIDMRLTFRHAERHGVIPGDLRRELEILAKQLFYRDRTYAAVFDLGHQALPTSQRQGLDRLTAWLPMNRVEQKRRDAVSLVRLLAAGAWRCREARRPGKAIDLQDTLTEAWVRDLRHSSLFDLLHVEDVER